MDGVSYPFPLNEAAVWDYFLWLRQQRSLLSKGFTSPATFLETVRFAKFTVGLVGAEDILESKRLLGFAAIERSLKGPTKQAPGLELEHLQRLHEILRVGSSLVDRLGAAVFLICVYGRARWSDLRFVEYIEFDRNRNGSMTIYTKEHKTSNMGSKKEQYLPIIVPWEGVVTEWWIDLFTDVCGQLQIDLGKRPLGPLLPAPRLGGGFCSRPLSTGEAAKWLRSLLKGTSNFETFRSHSLKATLLIWCARSGLDKETRSVLGHHCSAVSGSEVVYSRHLQVRAIRKLSMLLRRVRIGLSIEDDAMREFGLTGTPALFTPAGVPQTPGVVAVQKPFSAEIDKEGNQAEHAEVIRSAAETMVQLEELQSVKDELLDLETIAQHADSISLFPNSLVQAGAIAIDSSSGSDSSSSYSSSSDEEPSQPRSEEPVGFPRNFIDAVKAHGAQTLSQLAFALGQPGQPIQDAAVDAFITAATHRAATLQEVANLKRVAFESQTFLIATLRQTVERSDDTPKKIAYAERATRMENLRRNLTGVSITGELEPAHCLLEKFCHMCSLVVYDLHSADVEDVEHVIKELKVAELEHNMTFVLISSVMVWANTRKQYVPLESPDDEEGIEPDPDAVEDVEVKKRPKELTDADLERRVPAAAYEAFWKCGVSNVALVRKPAAGIEASILGSLVAKPKP
eukprot:Skav228576  [mRNA]  locus=scaffold1470:20582:34006:+ [translate_table: standard]